MRGFTVLLLNQSYYLITKMASQLLLLTPLFICFRSSTCAVYQVIEPLLLLLKYAFKNRHVCTHLFDKKMKERSKQALKTLMNCMTDGVIVITKVESCVSFV